MSGVSIADIQAKFLDKLARKLPNGQQINDRSVRKVLNEFDGDNDGRLTLNEFFRAVERAGNGIDNQEAKFLFAYWDTRAGEFEPCGLMDIKLAVADLLISQTTYDSGFNSGVESLGVHGGGNKSNKPSQVGGIFGGGSYEADSRGEPPAHSHRGAPSSGFEARAPFEQVQRPRGNQSSVQGGIFGEEPENLPMPSQRGGGNQSNKSSIEGGIFGEARSQPSQREKTNYSNRSSIPGGIFG